MNKKIYQEISDKLIPHNITLTINLGGILPVMTLVLETIEEYAEQPLKIQQLLNFYYVLKQECLKADASTKEFFEQLEEDIGIEISAVILP